MSLWLKRRSPPAPAVANNGEVVAVTTSCRYLGSTPSAGENSTEEVQLGIAWIIFCRTIALAKSGAGTNLKVDFFWLCPSTLWRYSTISRFGERFRDGQYSQAALSGSQLC